MKISKKTITILSIAIPLVVAALFGIKIEIELPVFLPPIYASINALTGLVLITALWAILNKKTKLHELLMKIALTLSAIFLLLYILYHMTSEPTPYSGEGWLKTIYYTILISHIILSVAVIPLVLFTFTHGILKNFEKHKKIARISYPLWLYVTISGVLVYWMISDYY